ncbi:MAG: DUF2726 domain-containing protein [Anaerolineales bacterium]|nr:DUF2726 domain-containing protein [Anaerolineales bacterium]
MVRDNSKRQKTLPPLNPERVYQFLAQKKWSELVDLFHAYSKVIPTDYALEAAFKVVESEFIRNFEEFQQDEKFERNLSNLYLIHSGKLYLLSDVTLNKLIIELAKLHDKKGDVEQAYYYAAKLPQDSFCANIIEKYSQTLPKVISHSQSQKILVTENKNISSSNYTISLFKSPQEHDFFMAVRDVFPLFMAYPNVALSTLIDFDKVQSFLSSDEKSYFFTAVVDCVVFDQHKEYIPVYFFELDSSTHDNENQRKRDKMKDNILAAAGQRLYRIRKLSHSQGRKVFMKLVSEVVLQ